MLRGLVVSRFELQPNVSSAFSMNTAAPARNHRDNAGLRELMRRRIPLVYFFGLLEGRYLAAWPVFVVDNAARNSGRAMRRFFG